jgi:hypothetical protein
MKLTRLMSAIMIRNPLGDSDRWGCSTNWAA